MESLDGISLDFQTRLNTTQNVLTSVGGFSKPERRHIKSLQDLVVTLRRLDLEVFDGAKLRNAPFVGEGGSYRVSICEDQVNGQAYAIKEIKIPPATAGSGSFERQIGCVLRDIETMACLSTHENILNVFGYGWNIRSGSVIPFVVTEFAAHGTLRNYLKNEQIAIHKKLSLCRDIAEGLHALHTCGVAHGDLKLENILARSTQENSELSVTACISDFGHSLHLLDNEEDDDSWRRYGGTVAYNAPEISSHEAHEHESIDYQKCDIWSLGLLCWETFCNGQPYYQRPKVVNTIRESSETCRSAHMDTVMDFKAASFVTHLENTKPYLADIVCDDLSKELGGQLPQATLQTLFILLRQCLAAKSENRAADVPSLSFLRHSAYKAIDDPGPRLQISRKSNHSYGMFQESHLLPYTTKCQLVMDCKKVSIESSDSMTSAKACLQTALAFMNEFGCHSDIPEAIQQIERSVSKGLEVAQVFLPALSSLLAPTSSAQFKYPGRFSSIESVDNPHGDSDDSHVLEAFPNQPPEFELPWEEPQTRGKEPLFQPVFSNPHTRQSIIDSIHNSMSKHGSETQWYENTLLQLDASGTDSSGVINDQDGNGNTLLLLACKRSQIDTVRWLLDQGADPGLPDTNGCIPLHWLSVFNPETINDLSKRLAEGVDVNAVACQDQTVDPQIPLRLCGTPLAFAIEMESIEAVSALEALHADPFRGVALGGKRGNAFGSYGSSALHVVCAAHMTEPLSYMLEYSQEKKSCPKVNSSLARFCFSVFPSASRAELILRHGGSTRQAAENTAIVLIEFTQKYAKDLELSVMLQRAITYGNLEASYAILHAVKLLTPYQLYRKGELDRLFWHCTETACSSCFSKETSLKLLDFGLDMGGDINSVGWRGQRPITAAIANHDAEVLDWFLSNNAKVDVRNDQGVSPLQQLIQNGFSSKYDLSKLVPRCDSIGGPKEAFIRDAIETAVVLKNAKDVKKFVDYANFHANLGILGDIIHVMIRQTLPISGSFTILLDHFQIDGMSPKVFTTAVNNALIAAARSGSLDVIRILICNGADPSASDSRNLPCLYHAARSGKQAAVKLLLASGARPTLECTGFENSFLHHVLHDMESFESSLDRKSVFACAKLLVEAGTNINIKVPGLGTVFEYVLDQGSDESFVEFGKVLIQHGAAVNVEAENRETPLHRAIKRRDLELVHFLLESGASVTKSDKYGHNALHKAAAFPQTTGECRTGEVIPPCPFMEELLRINPDAHPLSDVRPAAPLKIAIGTNNGPACLSILMNFVKSRGIRHGPEEMYRLNQWKTMHRIPTRLGSLREHNPQSEKQSKERECFKLLKRAWDMAVTLRSWTCVCAFIQADLQGPTRIFNLASGSKLFQYALEKEIEQVLILFMGEPASTSFRGQDPHLGAIWKKIRSQLKCFDLTGFTDNNEIFSDDFIRSAENGRRLGLLEY